MFFLGWSAHNIHGHPWPAHKMTMTHLETLLIRFYIYCDWKKPCNIIIHYIHHFQVSTSQNPTLMMSLAIGLISTPCSDTMGLQHFRTNTRSFGQKAASSGRTVVASGRSQIPPLWSPRSSSRCPKRGPRDFPPRLGRQSIGAGNAGADAGDTTVPDLGVLGFTTENRGYLPSRMGVIVLKSKGDTAKNLQMVCLKMNQSSCSRKQKR